MAGTVEALQPKLSIAIRYAVDSRKEMPWTRAKKCSGLAQRYAVDSRK